MTATHPGPSPKGHRQIHPFGRSATISTAAILIAGQTTSAFEMNVRSKAMALRFRVVVSALGAGASFMILEKVQTTLPHGPRRIEMIFILALTTLILVGSLTDAVVQLARSSRARLRDTPVSVGKSPQRRSEIPLSTDITEADVALDSAESLSDASERVD